MEIVGSRITIKPLEVIDVFHMRYWGKHENLLLEDYDFPFYTDDEIKRWYKAKTKSIFNKYYAIRNQEGFLIGYLGIKDIRYILRSSTLGIVLDPNYVDQGYGTEILETFLEHYFTKMKMRRMFLEVAEFNSRAYRVYEKIGFVSIAYYLDEFHNHRLNLYDKNYLVSKSSFVITKKKIYNYIYKMKLDRKIFLKARKNT